MSSFNGFRLFQDNKSLIENVKKATHAFEIDKMKEYSEYEPFELIENAFDTGSKILKNFPNIGRLNSLSINKVINKDIFDDVKSLNISQHLEKVMPYIKEFQNKYSFPVLKEEDYVEFSEQLILFGLMYSFNRDLILISRHRTNMLKTDDSRYKYVTEILNPRIENFNNIGKILFKNFNTIYKIQLDTENEKIIDKIPICFHLKGCKGMLLNAVNEFSYKYSYTISSFIDVRKRCVCFTSEKVFNLIWHIFVNFVLADTLPEKITFCDSCGKMIENNTKIRNICKSCKNLSKNRKKTKKKK